MWLNEEHVADTAIRAYRKTLLRACPHHVVIDNFFNNAKLDEVFDVLQHDNHWQTQKHSYSALYVDDAKWQKTANKQRFVQRDVWQRAALSTNSTAGNVAMEFLLFLRSAEFMSLLSRIFKVPLTDLNVANPEINTNYFRLGSSDFVNQHADDSPGREVCMLLYLNKNWQQDSGGELVFMAEADKQITIAPLYNRCVLFDPSSPGSEHWVKAVTSENTQRYRYNVTSWYWSE